MRSPTIRTPGETKPVADAASRSDGPDATATVTRRDVWVRMLLYPRHTLPTAAAPVIVAYAVALRDGVAAPLPAAAAFLAGWTIQLGGVFSDNYHNLRRHPEDREHPAFVAALRRGVVTLDVLKRAVAACCLAALVPGAYLAWVGGLPAIAVGVVSVAASLAYSSGPFPLGDRALGDPLFFVFFGVVSVAGTYYVQAASVLAEPFPLAVPTGTVTGFAIWASLPVAALTTGILVIDNLRDRVFDEDKDEITIAVVLGDRGTRIEYLALVAFAYAVPVALWGTGAAGPWVLLPLLSLVYGVVVARRVWTRHEYEALVPMTPQQGQLLLLFSTLFALGVVL